jgi:hypothetical protein
MTTTIKFFTLFIFLSLAYSCKQTGDKKKADAEIGPAPPLVEVVGVKNAKVSTLDDVLECVPSTAGYCVEIPTNVGGTSKYSICFEVENKQDTTIYLKAASVYFYAANQSTNAILLDTCAVTNTVNKPIPPHRSITVSWTYCLEMDHVFGSDPEIGFNVLINGRPDTTFNLTKCQPLN